MRVDQLDDASRSLGGAEIDLRRLASHHRDFAAEIARAFRSRQPASAPEDPSLIGKILAAFDDLSDAPRARPRAKAPARAAEPPRVAPVPLPETIGLGFLLCLEDGVRCRDLGRHLGAVHELSPDQYRRRWGLPAAYPMLPPPSHEERQAWRRRLAPRAEEAGCEPPLRLQEESRRIGAGRARRRHRRGAPAGLRHDWGKPVPGRRSQGPRPDGFRR